MSFTVDFVFVDPCFIVDLQLQPSPFADATYNLRDPAMTQPWKAAQLISPLTAVDCGPITVEFINGVDDSSVLEPGLLLDDRTLDPDNEFTTLYTEDVTKEGAYPVRYRVYHSNYPGNVVEQTATFTITVVEPCLNPVSVTAPALQDQEYTITDLVQKYQVPVFVADPIWCSVNYSYEAVSLDGYSIATFDSDAAVREFSFLYDTDLDLSGLAQNSHTIRVIAQSGSTTVQEDFAEFNLIVKNPCIDPAFVTIQSVPLPVGEQYILHSYDLLTRYEFQHDAYTVVTQPIPHTLCGDLDYQVTFNTASIDATTSPMAYD